VPAGADRLSLLGQVTTLLRERGVAFALVGAGAMAVHGVSRATRDLDLLVTSTACLDPAIWAPLEHGGARVRIRRGDADDPLAGALRITAAGESPVDLVVGRSGWQADAIARATVRTIEGLAVPVVTASDLILLKLYAGGPQDAWDVEQLLDSEDRAALVASVGAALALLPGDSRRLWARIVGPR
jgi:hypothetical protein